MITIGITGTLGAGKGTIVDYLIEKRGFVHYSVRAFITEGGIKNQYLVKRIAQYAESQLVIPDENLIDYKEALIFAYLGYLRVNKQANCLASVTGARKNVCGGAIYLAN